MFTRVVVAAGVLAACGARAQQLDPIEQLGKELFFDNISSPAAQSCADCHSPSFGWTGPTAGTNLHGGVYAGAVPERFGNRKPPSSAYATFTPLFHFDEDAEAFRGGSFWDGRATGERLGWPSAEQAIGPFMNPVEQNMPSKVAVCEHVAASKYAALFEQVWGAGKLDCGAGVDATFDRIGYSIAEYEESSEVSPFSSRFDAYLRACLAAGKGADACGLGLLPQPELDPQGLFSAQEFEGLVQFGEYCNACHTSVPAVKDGTFVMPLLTDFTFDNVGVPRNPENPFYGMDQVFLPDGSAINPLGAAYVDRGLGDFLRRRPEWADLADENDGKFKVPTLRNVDARAGRNTPKAFMHNGALKSLEEVVHFYNTRDVAGAGWPPPEVPENVNREILAGVPLGNLALDATLEKAIVAFLKTLTDDPRFAPKPVK